MEYLSKHFPLAFASISEMMQGHGAGKRDGDDTEWRTHDSPHHTDHAIQHTMEYHGGIMNDPDSGFPHLTHAACRELMALEVYLGGGK